MSEIPLAFVVRDQSRRGVASFNTNMRSAQRSAGQTQKGFNSLSRSSGQLASAFQVLSGALSIRQLSRYTDTWLRLTNQLKVVEKTTTEVWRAQERLFKISQDTRQSLEGTVALYTRMRRAQDRLGLSSEELITVVTAVNRGIAVSGATTKEAEAGLIQLSQAFQSGKLAGDELRSVMENLPILAQSIAEGLGIPFDKFRDKAKDLTSQQLATGLLRSAKGLEEAFGRTGSTIGQSFQILENAVVRYTGKLDASLGVSKRFTDMMKSLALNIDDVARGLKAILTTITVFATGSAIKGLIGLAAKLNPLTAAIALIVTGLSAAYQFSDSISLGSVDTIDFGTIDTSMTDLISALGQGGIFTNIINAFSDLLAAIGAFIDNPLSGFERLSQAYDSVKKGFSNDIAALKDKIKASAIERYEGSQKQDPFAIGETIVTGKMERVSAVLKAVGNNAAFFSTALAGLDPKMDAVFGGIESIFTSFKESPILGAAAAFNVFLVAMGVAETQSQRMSRELRESAEASRAAAEALERFSSATGDFTAKELTKTADASDQLRAIYSGLLFNGDAKEFFNTSGQQDLSARDLGLDDFNTFAETVFGGGRDEILKGVATISNLPFSELLEMIANIKDVFRDTPLTTGEGFESVLAQGNAAKEQLSNFGEIITSSFAGASEAFSHNKAVTRPVGQAIIDMFTESFKEIANFDLSTGAITPLIDLTTRQFNQLEEMFVDVRLEAANKAAKRLVDGFSSNEDRLTALRFQKESISARANLSTSFNQAGGDTFLQKKALGEFETAMTAIKNSLVLARSRSGDAVNVPSASPYAGGTRAGKVAVTGGDSVAVDNYDSIIQLPDSPIKLEWDSVLDLARIEVTHWWDVVQVSSLDSAAKVRRWWHDAIHLRRWEITHWWDVVETSTLNTAVKIRRQWSDAVSLSKYVVSGWTAVVDTSALGGAAKIEKKWSDIFSFTRSSSMQSYLGEQVYDPTGWSAIVSLGNLSKHGRKWSDVVEFSRSNSHASYLKNPEDGDKSGWSSVIQFPSLTKHRRPFSDVIEFTRSNLNIGDMLGVSGRVNVGDLIDLQVDGLDFFFKIADKADEIKGAIENTFNNWPSSMRASVQLTDLINIDADGFREAVVAAVEEAAGDRQTGITVSRGYGSGYAG